NELWPVVGARTSTFLSGAHNPKFVDAPGPTGLNLTAAFNPRFVGSGRFSGGIIRALLYCHGIVIEDPLVMAADMFLSAPVSLRPVARKAIEAALINLIEVEELIDRHIVQTFFAPSEADTEVEPIASHISEAVTTGAAPVDENGIWEAFEAGFVDGLNPYLQELWRAVRAGNRNPDLDYIIRATREEDPEIVQTFIDVLSSLRPADVVKNAIAVAAQAIADANRLGGGHDLLAPSELFAQLVAVGCADRSDDMRLAELARTDVPRLDDLSLRDIVRIRQASDTLDRWRYHVSIALERAHQLRSTVGPDANLSTEVREVMTEACAHVLGHSARSDLPQRSKQHVMGFIAGIIGGTVAGSAGGPVGAVAGAVGGSVPALYNILSGKWNRPPGFVRRHYLVFERKTA
ncbi:MAG: hypothetical protein ACREQV_12975, partial [Candidatus Binatia bacterium]